jgi:AraC family transcriptional activator of pobA
MKQKYRHYDIGRLLGTKNNKLEFILISFDELQLLLKEIDLYDVAHHHKHSFYIIGWVDQGFCTHFLDKRPYNLKKQTLFFINPGQVHENNFTVSNDFSGGVMMLSYDFLSSFRSERNSFLEITFLDNAFQYPQLELVEELFKILHQTIDLIVIEQQMRTNEHDLIFKSLILTFLLQIQREIDKDLLKIIKRPSLNIFKQFTRLTEMHYKKEKSINYFASSLNITSRHLSRIIKESSGKTPNEILRSRKILEAKRLLKTTDKSISEIAFEIGFNDISYFNNVFKKEVGTTPLNFKNANVLNLQ